MGQAYLVRRGGAGGGFKVTSYPDATNLPEKASVNTIAVITDIAVKKLHIQSNSPEAPSLGDVWFSLGAGSTPHFQVYNGEAWAMVDAYLFDGTTWEQVSVAQLYLYNAGNKYPDNSGGWAEKTESNASITWNNGYLAISFSSSNLQYASVYTKANLDVTLFSKLVLVGRITEKYSSSSNYYVSFGVAKSPYTGTTISSGHSSLSAGRKITDTDTSYVTYEVDLSGVSGEHRVQIMSSGCKVRVSKVYLTV